MSLARRPKPAVLAVVALFLLVYLSFTLFPFYWMLNTSFKSKQDAYRTPPQFVPERPVLINYGRLLNEDSAVLRFFLNSMIVGVGTVTLCLAAGALAGYSLARFPVPARRSVMVFILMSQMFPMALLLIPIYVYFVRARLLDTHAAVILAHSAIALPFSAWLLKGYVDTVPREIEEAAAIDGSSRLGILVRVVSPMIAPGLVTAGVVSFLMSWREFLFALALTTTPRARPLGPGIHVYYFGIMSMRWENIMAAAVVATIPVIVLYMVLQRYVVGGLTGGAVRG